VVLDVLAWGGDPRTLDWFDAPRPDAVAAALTLLERLGAVKGGTLTELGSRLRLFPLHPRLSRILMQGQGVPALARACALIAERHFLAPRSHATPSDLLSALDDWSRIPHHVQQVAREIDGIAARVRSVAGGSEPPRQISDAEFCRAVLAGYPDRVAQRREAGSPRLKLASGAGAVLTPESGVRDGEFLVAVDVRGSTRADRPEHLVRVASRVEREWLEPNAVEVVHWFDDGAGAVRAVEVARYDALTLSERPVPADEATAARLLADRWLARGPQPRDMQLLRRIAFAGGEIDVSEVVARAASGVRALADVSLRKALGPELLRALDRDAPESLRVPSGRSVALEYTDGGGVTAAVKLQELFGLAETPRIGPSREPVLFALLAPNGRTVQLTRDLASFWHRTYPEVRKELRGRYPRHPWPDDPLSATPTARPVSRKRP
jgi:ATP-dependent helicase HrpB